MTRRHLMALCAHAWPLSAQASRRVQSLKVTILTTMLSGGRGIGEWGFAALVEADGRRFLFDTGGRPDTIVINARELGIDLTGTRTSSSAITTLTTLPASSRSASNCAAPVSTPAKASSTVAPARTAKPTFYWQTAPSRGSPVRGARKTRGTRRRRLAHGAGAASLPRAQFRHRPDRSRRHSGRRLGGHGSRGYL